MSEKRFVRMFLGEGPNRTEIGEAEVEDTPEGPRIGRVIITNPEVHKDLFDQVAQMNPLVKETPLTLRSELDQALKDAEGDHL